jgi:hypothetical protein
LCTCAGLYESNDASGSDHELEGTDTLGRLGIVLDVRAAPKSNPIEKIFRGASKAGFGGSQTGGFVFEHRRSDEVAEILTDPVAW